MSGGLRGVRPAGGGGVMLQRLLWPDPAFNSEPALYVHLNPFAVCDLAEGVIELLPGGRAGFDTYMNLFNLANWSRGCDLPGLTLEVQGEGRVHLQAWRLQAAEGAREVLADTVLTLDDAGCALDLSDLLEGGPQPGLVAFAVTALGPARLTGGGWRTTRAAPPRPIRLTLAITTYRREAAVVASAARIAGFLAGDGAAALAALGCEARLVIVDNGKSVTLPPCLAADPRVTLLPNSNLGGAGGFARGLAAAEDSGATHCLFMDDDASAPTEAILRVAAWLRFARSPRAAVAGAMISAQRPWAMWENGAVFDRACHPLHVGTDLRRPAEVAAMELAIARPKPAGFYGGWWFFAFPLQGLRHHPFPFFVRGDDISFSLANGFDTATLNGVVSLQEDFSAKESPLTLYLDLRNHLHHHLVHEGLEIGAAGTAGIALRFVMRSVFRMHYESAEAQLLAWADVLRGPQLFEADADLRARRPAVTALIRDEAWRPVIGPDAPVPQDPGMRYGRRMKRVLNGLLVPFWGLFGGRAVIPVTHRGLIWPLWGLREATFLNADGTQGYTVRHSKRRGWGLTLRALWLALLWWRAYPRLRAAHRAAYPRLASRDFWDRQRG